MDDSSPFLLAIAITGVGAGLWLLVRGLGGFRTAGRLRDTSTSSIASMAAGEVRIAGVIEPAEVTLVSPLQSEPCVYYRASVRSDRETVDLPGGDDLAEERAVGFRVRDASGSVRVFPRGAHWDAPQVYDERSGSFSGMPLGLRPRTGPAVAMAEPEAADAIAALLQVQPFPGADTHPLLRRSGRDGDRRFQESRLAPGDAVTIVGRAMPFGDLADPAEADVAIGGELAADDPEVAADLAEAREAGLLVGDPEEAWGNAAIPGFGIGQPTRAPELHPDAHVPSLAGAEVATRFERTFHIPPEELVLAGGPGARLLIAHGTPGAATDRHDDRFLIGLLGAVLAIGSAVAVALLLGSGGIAS